MEDVLKQVKEIISEYTSHSVEVLTAETKLDDINVQSLDMYEIVFALEERFKIVVPENTNAENRMEFTTVGAIAEGVRSLMAKSDAA